MDDVTNERCKRQSTEVNIQIKVVTKKKTEQPIGTHLLKSIRCDGMKISTADRLEQSNMMRTNVVKEEKSSDLLPLLIPDQGTYPVPHTRSAPPVI